MWRKDTERSYIAEARDSQEGGLRRLLEELRF
jgi:hypothetical protein